jgi:hypothetical protein
MFNRGKNKNNTSGVKGVSFCKDTNTWVSRIMVNRKTIHVGRFADKHDALRAYLDKAKEYRGEFATC